MRISAIAAVAALSCALVSSVGQLFFKAGAEQLPSLFTNIPLAAGLVCYGFAAVLLVVALNHGNVTSVYPLIATSFAWVALLSFAVFSEPLGLLKSAGIASIFAGVAMTAAASGKRGKR